MSPWGCHPLDNLAKLLLDLQGRLEEKKRREAAEARQDDEQQRQQQADDRLGGEEVRPA